MSKEWVLLIQAGNESVLAESSKTRYKFPPIGLLSISSILITHGFVVKILDLLTETKKISEIKRKLIEWKKEYGGEPLFIGVGVYTDTFLDGLEHTKLVKSLFRNSLIIMGGAHIKGAYEEALKSGIVDIAVSTEGEGNIIEIAMHAKYPNLFPKRKIRGIAYIENGEVKTTEHFFLHNLDILPFPAFKVINFNNYREVGIIVSSRGCPGRCIFCASMKFSGRKYRFNTANYVCALIYFLCKKYKIVDFGIMDDTFTVLSQRTIKICKLILKNKLQINFHIKSRVDFIKEKVLYWLKLAGCDSVHIGVESGDDGVLKALRKNTTVEQNLKAIELLAKYGLTPECSLMIGNPTDNEETIFKTLIFAYVIDKYFSAALGISTPYPGTSLFENRNLLGIRILTYDWRRYDTFTPIYETAAFSAKFLTTIWWKYNTNKEGFIAELVSSNTNLQELKNTIEKRILKAYKNFRKVNKNGFIEVEKQYSN